MGVKQVFLAGKSFTFWLLMAFSVLGKICRWTEIISDAHSTIKHWLDPKLAEILIDRADTLVDLPAKLIVATGEAAASRH